MATMPTVKISVSVTLDGQPITKMLEAAASMEQMADDRGLHIHLALDGQKFAEALLPHLAIIRAGLPEGAQEK